MFAFQWREFSPPLNSIHRQKRDRRRCNSRGTQNRYFSLRLPPLLPTRDISQWARSLELTSRCDVAHSGGENLHHYLPFLLRGMLPLFSVMTLFSTPTWSLRLCWVLGWHLAGHTRNWPISKPSSELAAMIVWTSLPLAASLYELHVPDL